MKEARYYKILKEEKVKCNLCPKNCTIFKENTGLCKARKNIEGKLYSLIYGKACTLKKDPIEKKPLYHFLPGTNTFSVGTVGCNLKCNFCQNWEISTSESDLADLEISPESVIEDAIENKCQSISFTYNEPTINYEFILETAKLAKKYNIKTIMVTNGFINLKPLKELYNYIDAANIDLKAFNNKFYEDNCFGDLEPILKAIKEIQKTTWIEITNLIIPSQNDNELEFKKMCKWIVNNLGIEVPVHFSAYHPEYKSNHPSTPKETLEKAKEIAKAENIRYVYLGNIQTDQSTYCPNCNKPLIVRSHYNVIENNIKDKKCFNCQEDIVGVYK